MIRKTKDGYVVISESSGRRLSKPYKSREQAEERLRQIERIKHAKERRQARRGKQ